MIYFLHTENINNKQQMFKARPYDGKTEGDGLSMTIEHDGQQMDVGMNKEEVKEFIQWLNHHFEG